MRQPSHLHIRESSGLPPTSHINKNTVAINWWSNRQALSHCSHWTSGTPIQTVCFHLKGFQTCFSRLKSLGWGWKLSYSLPQWELLIYKSKPRIQQSLIRFMVCMGGPGENVTANPAMGHRIDTANTVCYTQYITPWPLTHPCCAPVFFSSSVDCDRRQRNEVFHEARRQFTSIKDILISLPCCSPSCVKAEGVGLVLSWFTGSLGWVSG